MGLLDQLVSGVVRSVLAEGGRNLPNVLSRVLAGAGLGGVGGLLQQLQQAGFGREVSSWLGNGSNMPISAEQLRAALGDERLQEIARSAGLPVDQLLAALSQHLPGAVDQMSPQGQLEEETTAEGSESESGSAGSDDAEGDASEGESGGALADDAGLGDVGRR